MGIHLKHIPTVSLRNFITIIFVASTPPLPRAYPTRRTPRTPSSPSTPCPSRVWWSPPPTTPWTRSTPAPSRPSCTWDTPCPGKKARETVQIGFEPSRMETRRSRGVFFSRVLGVSYLFCHSNCLLYYVILKYSFHWVTFCLTFVDFGIISPLKLHFWTDMA